MNKVILSKIKYWIIAITVLIIISFILSTNLPMLQSFRIVFGSFFVLFLPGHILTYIFFPMVKEKEKDERKLDPIQRILLSFALSMAVGPLILFLINKIGVKINILSISLVTGGIIIFGLIFLWLRNERHIKSNQST